MKIRLTIKEAVTGDEWIEDYVTSEDPNIFATNLIDNFNNTLRPNEHLRKFTSIEIIEDEGENDEYSY